ncbi:GNAT family N-acetyltransferase [Streptosporangium fragile]|uniref:GNAT family N-acetyltransferase n=1 Tax=Streptosporangium fragile TaxID=46186 RepID=A0ABN3W3M7_9ACTN
MSPYDVHLAEAEHLEGARGVMLDTFYREFGYGYRPEWHRDVIDLDGVYLRPARHALFVATKGGEVVGTTAVRAGGPSCPPHPRFLADRYPAETTAQLFRVYVRPEHRRHGLARAMVGLACRFVADVGGYEALYLHTDTRVDGAEAFWRSLATVVHDARDGDHEHFQTVHFEIPLGVEAVTAAQGRGTGTG